MANEQDLKPKNSEHIEIPSELLAEFKAWERASDEAWQMIDQMEQEEGFASW